MNHVSQSILMRILNSIANSTAEERVALSDDEIQNLPRRTVGENENPVVCAVCLDNIGHNQTVIDLSCNHTFHEQCLVNWFLRHNTCPLCRQVHGENNQEIDHHDDIMPRVRLTIVPAQTIFTFAFTNGTRINICKDPYNTSLVELFHFLVNFSNMNRLAEIIIVNLDNPIQSYRTSQSFQYLSQNLSDFGITRDTTFHVYNA